MQEHLAPMAQDSEGMDRSILTTTLSARPGPGFRFLTACGLGAETPSQLMILLLAANLGGIGNGFVSLAMFVAGPMVMNT
jgi:hypothetical protein